MGGERGGRAGLGWAGWAEAELAHEGLWGSVAGFEAAAGDHRTEQRGVGGLSCTSPEPGPVGTEPSPWGQPAAATRPAREQQQLCLPLCWLLPQEMLPCLSRGKGSCQKLFPGSQPPEKVGMHCIHVLLCRCQGRGREQGVNAQKYSRVCL